MAPPIPIRPWHWTVFILLILALVALDLRSVRRAPAILKMRPALLRAAFCLLLALLFAAALAHWRSREESLQFLAGCLVEFSLSLDNVFAITAIFASFALPPELHHRVLTYGILGAMLMRGLMIGAGAALLQQFHWLLYLMGLFLLVTGLRWAFLRPSAPRPLDNPAIRLARKFFPVSADFAGGQFFTIDAGRRALTPLALVLLAVETTDLVFAVDSIPAVFAITQNAFLVFTSNMFAILAMRSLYFVVAGAINSFRHLRFGLAIVLVVIGLKMLAAPWYSMPMGLFLALIALIVAAAIVGSTLPSRRAMPTQ
jgi:tellurite resistance protein TerC